MRATSTRKNSPISSLDNLVMEEAERAAKQSVRELRSILREKDREIWNVEES